MQSPDTATSDETVGALACLLSFEMSKGSREALTHLQGLQSIVSLKGGLDRLRLSGVPTMIETLDLLHAVLFDSHPMLTETVNAQCSSTSTSVPLSDAEAFQRLTPILVAEQEDLQRSILYADQLEAIPTLLRDATDCLQNEGLQTDNSADTAIEKFKADIVAFGQKSCVEDPLNPDALHLGRCCYFTFSTLFNVTVNKAPHRHAKNQKLVEQLYDAIQRVKNGTWSSIPYLRLFILLSAAVTTSRQSMKSFFKAELVRSIYQMGTEEWQRIKTFILRFLDMKQVLERPERRTSAPIDMDTSRMFQVAPEPWHIPRYTTSISLESGMDYGHDLSGAVRAGALIPATLTKTPSISTTAADSLHPTPYEENIDPFLRLDY